MAPSLRMPAESEEIGARDGAPVVLVVHKVAGKPLVDDVYRHLARDGQWLRCGRGLPSGDDSCDVG